MRSLPVLLLCGVLSSCSATAPAVRATGPAPSPPPTRDPASTVYEFEGVEIFGSRRFGAKELLGVLVLPPPGTQVDLKEKAFWDAMAESKAALTSRFQFAEVRFNLVAFPPTGKARVTVDLVDAGDGWRMAFLPAPTGDLPDPGGLIAAWQAADKERWALRNGGEIPVSGEGTCRALACVANFGHPRLAVLEEAFISGVPANEDAIARVLREDKDELDRMAAASLLVYGTSRRRAVEALTPSLPDPSVGVRNEVLRSLGELQHRQQELLLPVASIATAVWYPSSSDRNKAAWALVRIVEATGREHRETLLRIAGEMLAMMAGLKTETDSEPALKVLRGLSGEDFGASETRWRRWLAEEGFSPRA